MAKIPNIEALQLEIEAFKSLHTVIFMASSDINGVPEASHTPFAMDQQGKMYILISELAKHTHNLRVNPTASLLLLESENKANNAFALRRLQFECQAEFLGEGESLQRALSLLKDRFGKFIDTLSSLGDFRVVRLTPHRGKFVRGFAQTFRLSGQELIDIEAVQAKV